MSRPKPGESLEGTPITEEEAAHGLGFKDVDEFRRWQTAEGQRAWELENKLRECGYDRDNFRWHVKRMSMVLERIIPLLEDNRVKMIAGGREEAEDLLLACKVVLGKETDWDNKLTWLFKKEE